MSVWGYSITQDLKASLNPHKLQQERVLQCQKTES